MRKTTNAASAALLFLLIILGAVAAGCGSASPQAGTSASPASKTLIVFGAGTLAKPWAAEFAAFQKAHPGVTIHSQFSASGDRVKAITQLGQPADVLGVADYSLIPNDLFPHYATWYVGFVSNEITFAYTANSKGASQLTSRNWYKILSRPGVKIGRSNPAADPSGYQILQMLKLAQTYYHKSSLSASVLKNSPASAVAETETSLIAALQSGQIDYLAIYRSDALQHGFKYIHLPVQINLSDPALAKTYATVSVQGVNGPTFGKPIIYGLTIPTNAPNAALARQFVAFLLGSQGQAIMRENGFEVISPAIASPQSALPSSLLSLTAPWPK
jgi:molybdate/tungstate transport system substrate-binding protein